MQYYPHFCTQHLGSIHLSIVFLSKKSPSIKIRREAKTDLSIINYIAQLEGKYAVIKVIALG